MQGSGCCDNIFSMKRLNKLKRDIWLPWFLTRLVVFLFVLSVSVFFLYIIGNFQGFADATQYFLFSLMKIFFYIFFCASLLNVFVLIFIPGKRKKNSIFFFIKYFLMIFIVAVFYFSVSFLFKFIEKVNI